MVSPSEQCPRGPWNALHEAANEGSFQRVFSVVSTRSIEINQGSPKGYTPLMLASDRGHGVIVRYLLESGAIATAIGDNGATALHVAAKHDHVDVAIMLLAAGADVGVSSECSGGFTPLHLAAQCGRWRVMQVLIRADADVDARLTDGATAMYLAAEAGKLEAVKVLLLYEARVSLTTERGATPLDMAVQKCHMDIVRELIERVGMEGCGGFERGVLALRLAAQTGQTGIMTILYAAGSRDKEGVVLCAAIMYGGEEAVQFLLERPCSDTYANSALGAVGKPLLCCIAPPSVTVCSPRIMRRLINAGAATSFTFACLDDDGNFLRRSTPLQLVTKIINEKKSGAVVFNQDQMHGLRGMHRLLLQVDSVHAVSWGWAISSAVSSSTAPALQVPIRRERAAIKTRVCLRALFR